MRDSKPQRCVQQHESLTMIRNATNQEKTRKQIFANNLFKISCKYKQGMLFNWNIGFNSLNIQKCDEILCYLNKTNETVQRMICTIF